jgi:hypothetical protein
MFSLLPPRHIPTLPWQRKNGLGVCRRELLGWVLSDATVSSIFFDFDLEASLVRPRDFVKSSEIA